MQQAFYELADHLTSLMRGGEVYTCYFSGEVSDFVRFNKSAIRQPGRVTQRHLFIDLISGSRHASGTIGLSGDPAADKGRVADLAQKLRDAIPHLPEDPHLLYSTEVRSGERIQESTLPSPAEATDAILAAGRGRDLVGIYAAGGIFAGFANSFGQRNWYANHSFNFDWSFYHAGDKAVKCSYAGFAWDQKAFETKVAEAARQLEVLALPPKVIQPGKYRVYLTPNALYELLGTLCWSGFGLKDNKTRQSCFLKMIDGEARLHESVTILENTAKGVAPDFQAQGFIKPPHVALIEKGRYANSLASPRSAKEYGVPTNGASDIEMPESLDMQPGTIPAAEALSRLGTGVYVSNLWYLNYSDRPACRITGMTRFATLWVENGKIAAPLSVMRFDETTYRMLGEKLVGLTDRTEMILDAYTYESRSVGSGRVPGALIEDFTFTL
ncbi:MAG: TldE/PmbA family protein [Candidatus Eisenbacteria bacterium]|nr:TldE/PmbA family protein [Candidatus Eisenbacteria bacterium]